MSKISWVSGIGGSWAVGSDWSGGQAPTAADDAAIAQAGTYTVNVAGVAVARSLTIDAAGATVDDVGTLAPAGLLLLQAGTLDLNGMIAGGTIAVTGGRFDDAYATLAGVTVEGTLELAAPSGYLVANGLTLAGAGAGGVGGGTINLAAGNLAFNTQTLTAGTIDLGNGLGLGYGSLSVLSGGTLTLGAQARIEDLGLGQSTGALVNRGTIDAGVRGASLLIAGPLVNQGMLQVTNGDRVGLVSGSLVNSGTINVATGGVLALPGDAVSNTGSINASGGIIVLTGRTVPAELAVFAHSGGVVELAGTLDNTSGTLQLGAGTAIGRLVLGGGEIAGGTVRDTGGGLIAAGGTLDNVTYQGTLDVAASLVVADGIAATGSGGSGAGLIDVTAPGAQLTFLGSQIVDNARIELGGVLGGSDFFSDPVGELTLGRHLLIEHSAGGATLAGIMVNEGTILAGLTGGSLTIDPLNSIQNGSAFVNQGSIAVSNGDAMTIAALANAGTISVAAGGILDLGGAGLSNSGVISETDATVNLLGSLDLPTLNSISRAGGVVDVAGTLNEGGGTLAVGGGSALGALRVTGTIANGTIRDGGGGLTFIGNSIAHPDGGTLQNVTYQGALTLASALSRLTVEGLTLTGAGGNGAGTLNMTGVGSEITLQGSQTLDNATINLGAGDILLSDPQAAGATLTLGPNATIIQRGPSAQILIDRAFDDVFSNHGSILAGAAGGSFGIDGGAFGNTGLLDASNGETVSIGVVTLLNVSANTITGGSFEADAGSTIHLGAVGPIQADNATVTLSGVNSRIDALDPTTFNLVSLDQTLNTVGPGGALRLLDRRSFTASASLTDNGTVQVQGGVVTASSLGVGAQGVLSGFGTVAASVADAGTIQANGGTLVVWGSVSGAGAATIAGGAALQLESSDNTGVAFADVTGGPLALAAPGGFAGTIAGFGGADTIDLINIGATGLSYSPSDSNGGVLTVLRNAGTLATLHFQGSYAASSFKLASDGHGGTLIEDPPLSRASGPTPLDFKVPGAIAAATAQAPTPARVGGSAASFAGQPGLLPLGIGMQHHPVG
ncbi:MAG: hypothetical protein M3Y41_00010 [Pseudomonadota bacterium]|nr:hypothetical protein [Pseudomonadota bacterium]